MGESAAVLLEGVDEEKITDAKFEVISAPPKAGDAHPDHPGWYYTGRRDIDGEPIMLRFNEEAPIKPRGLLHRFVLWLLRDW